jgi:hypothetical protein
LIDRKRRNNLLFRLPFPTLTELFFPNQRGGGAMRWIVLGLLGLAVAWIIWTYNLLINLRHRIENSWKQIDVQLKRRHDLIPNLVETVKGYMQYEQDTLRKVMEARSKAVNSTSVKESAEAETLLTQTLGRIFALMENYPELKAKENALGLQEELSAGKYSVRTLSEMSGNMAQPRQFWPLQAISKTAKRKEFAKRR